MALPKNPSLPSRGGEAATRRSNEEEIEEEMEPERGRNLGFLSPKTPIFELYSVLKIVQFGHFEPERGPKGGPTRGPIWAF